MHYKQFCPIAKAAELLGDKWTFLILRELLSGGHRFNEFQRGLSAISPTLLTARLRQLEEAGLLQRVKRKGLRGNEYYLTQSGKDVLPIIQELGKWGMKWARNQIADEELDVELLMLYLVRSIDVEYLPGNETVLHFKFHDLEKLQNWWLIVQESNIDVCLQDPHREVDIWINTDTRTMMEVWMGDKSYVSAIKENRLKLVGPNSLVKHVTKWLRNSDFAPRARQQ